MSAKTYSWEESRKMCQVGVCKHATYDMDGVYCAHPKSFELVPCFGASTNYMSLSGNCTGCFDDPAKNKRQLFEPISVRYKP